MRQLPENFSSIRGGEKAPRVPDRATLVDGQSRLLGLSSVFDPLSLFWKKIAGIKDSWFILPGIIFLTFTDVMDKSVRAEIDITFTLFITLAVLLWFYLYENLQKPTVAWIASLSFVSVATLTKGLQAPAFFYCGVLPYLIYKRKTRRFFSASHIAGVCAALAIFSAWFVPFTDRIGTEEVLKTWWHEIATRQEPIKAGGFFRHFIEFVSPALSYSLSAMVAADVFMDAQRNT